VGYDVELIQIPPMQGVTLPLEGADAKASLSRALKMPGATPVREMLLAIEGCRPGPGESVDFLGKGLNYARLTPREKSIHLENNCGAAELIRIYNHLIDKLPGLLIHDLQSGQVHDAASFERWWSRPL
jgi:hypothetical protein